MSKPCGSGDVVSVLREQHAEIRRAFRLAALPWPGRARAFRQLVRLLSIHEAAEEAHVHPVARRAAEAGRALARARRAEEKDARKLLLQLTRIGPHGRGYLPALLALQRMVLAHAAREEREEFPALLARVSRPRRRMLGIEVRLARVVAPTRPHPLAGNELAAKLAMPIFGPLDRGRDLLREIRRS